MRLFVIFSLVAWAHAVQYGASAPRGPFSKIIKMLNNLQVELQQELDTEKGIFDKWLCWAQNLQGDSQATVDNGADKIADLESIIETTAADKGRLSQESAEAQVEAERAHTAIVNAKTLREKENEKFDQDVEELQSCVTQVREALTALAKVGANGAATAGIGELGYGTAGFLQAHTEVAQKLESLKIKNRHLDPDQQDALNAFLQGQTSNSSVEVVAGMLRAIEDNCTKDLTATQDAEHARQSSYVEVFRSNSKLMNAATEQANTKNSRAAKTLQANVDASNELHEVQANVQQAQLVLAELAREIPTRKDGQDARAKAISDEIAAISEATGLLAEAREYTSFLELSSKIRDDKKEEAKKEAGAILNKVSEMDNNVAMIALQLKAEGTTFDRIISLVRDMIGKVEQDEANAKTKYDWCENETADLQSTMEKLSNDGKVLEASINREKASQDAMDETLSGAKDQIRLNGNAATDATEQRNKENAEYNQAEKDSIKTTDLLKRAIEVLEAYFAGRSGPGEGTAGSVSTAFIQIHQVPSFETTAIEDQWGNTKGRESAAGVEPMGLPNQAWSGSKKGRNAITVLQQALADQEADLSAMRHIESEAVAEYNALTLRLQASTEAQQELITTTNTQLANSQQALVKAEKDTVTWNKDTEINRAERLVTDKSCSELLMTYLQRSAIRKQEVESMNSCLAVLSNYNNSPKQGFPAGSWAR